MSESQQGPEICDIISAKCFLNAVYYVVRSFSRAYKLDKKSVWNQAT